MTTARAALHPGALRGGTADQKNEGITKMLVHYAQELIHPDDRSRYLAYCDPKTVLARLMAQPHSRLFDCFRVRDRHGNYSWKEFTATLLPNSGKHAFLTTVQELNLRPHTLETLLQETGEPSVLPISDELAALLWKNLQHSSQLCYFWKDRQRRFVGASRAFLDYHGFASEQAILGKTDEEMGWHVDNEPYRNDELAVLEKGHVVNNAPGHCIIHGTIHHITCYKWPIYQDGQIIGLMGTFFDVDNILRKNLEDAKITYQDMLTGLMNRQGLLDALMRYEEQWRSTIAPTASSCSMAARTSAWPIRMAKRRSRSSYRSRPMCSAAWPARMPCSPA